METTCEERRNNILIETLTKREIYTVFQPIFHVESGEVFGYEILSRHRDPGLSILTLFETATEMGLLWELEKACRKTAIETVRELPGELRESTFFLNISPAIFEDPRFVSGVTRRYLERNGIDPARVVVELTERSSVVDYARFEDLLRHYAGQGFRFALDDFGAGHSGLITLLRLNPEYLKLDQHLLRGIERDRKRQKLLESIVDFASHFNIRIIAEGVEREEELWIVRRLGIDYVQGYLLGMPGPLPQTSRDITRRAMIL